MGNHEKDAAAGLYNLPFNKAWERISRQLTGDRPAGGNADDWQLWLEQNAESGLEYKAVQIAEAIDEAQARGAEQSDMFLAKLAFDIVKECRDLCDVHDDDGDEVQEAIDRIADVLGDLIKDPVAFCKRPEIVAHLARQEGGRGP
jgi:hypothetical protein